MAQELVPPDDDMDRVVTFRDGSEFTVAQLYARVVLLDPGIIHVREAPLGFEESLPFLTNAAVRLSNGKPFGIVLDLVDAKGETTAGYRKFIPKHFTELFEHQQGRLVHLAVAFGGSPVARIASKFLIGRMMKIPISIDKDRDSAADAVRKALAEQ